MNEMALVISVDEDGDIHLEATLPHRYAIQLPHGTEIDILIPRDAAILLAESISKALRSGPTPRRLSTTLTH